MSAEKQANHFLSPTHNNEALGENPIRPWNVSIAILGSVLLAFPTVLGLSLEDTGYPTIGLKMSVFLFLGFTTLFTLIQLVLFRFLTKIGNKDLNKEKRFFLAPSWSLKSIVIHALMLFVIWLPIAIIFYPGTMGWDSFYQIFQFQPEHDPILLIPWRSTGSYIPNQFCDHHPIFDTLIFGTFAYLSNISTGSWNAGLFAYVLIQMLFMAGTFSFTCAYMKRRHLGGNIACNLAFLFFCLFPVIPLYAITILKDTLFSWIFVLYFVVTLEIVLGKGAILHKKEGIAAFIVLSVLLCLTKKTGIYVVFVESLTLLAIFRDRWKPIVVSLGLCIILMNVFLPRVIFPVLDVAPGGKQESLSILFQATARLVDDYGEDVSPEEKATIDKVLKYDELSDLYNPQFSDPVKYSYRWDTATQSDLRNYYRVFVAQGIRHPDAYFNSFASLLAGYFSPKATISLYVSQGTSIDERVNASFNETTEAQRTAIIHAYSEASSIPFISLFFSNVMYGWWIPLIVLFLVVQTPFWKKLLPAFMPILLAIGSYFITPVVFSRYLLPLIYLTPPPPRNYAICIQHRGMHIAMSGKTPRQSGAASSFAIAKLKQLSDRQLHCLIFFALFVAWLPWIVLQVPGALGGDAYNQLYQFFCTDGETWYTTMNCMLPGELIDHHPYFDTLIFGGAVWLGKFIFKSYTAGLFIYSLLQTLLTLGVFTRCLLFLWQKQVPNSVLITIGIFIAVHPYYPLYATTMEKDSLFAPIFTLFLLEVFEIAYTAGRHLSQRRNWTRLFLLGLLLILTNKKGFYIFIAVYVTCLVVYPDYKRHIASLIFSTLFVTYFLIPTLLFPLIGGVAKGGQQESFGFAMQETTAVLIAHPDDISQSEKASLEEFYDVDKAIRNYDSHIVDPVKNTFHAQSANQVISFTITYLKLGIRHPFTYIRSRLQVIGSMFAPFHPLTTYQLGTKMGPVTSYIVSSMESHSNSSVTIRFIKPSVLDDLNTKAQKGLVDIATFNLFSQNWFWSLLLPSIVIAIGLQLFSKGIVAYIAVITVMVFEVLSPDGLTRYLLPLMYAGPLMLGSLWVFALKKEPDYLNNQYVGSMIISFLIALISSAASIVYPAEILKKGIIPPTSTSLFVAPCTTLACFHFLMGARDYFKKNAALKSSPNKSTKI